jgi:outer membrane protein OmpA-like peptidoglycan-associated protein
VSDFDRLREVLLGDERARLDQQARALEQLRETHDQLPLHLPQLLQAAQRGDGREALHRALAPAVSAALAETVRRDRRSIVDALFPIIGPTIRKAIAEALRSFVADLNRALEQSLSMRGWAWRFEAWRSRVPYAQVVVKHTLRYRIDHLFVIERESGLLLHRYSAPELPDLDSDAIAGMLTAIGDFVRDSVRAEADSDGGLASATVGEHLLQVHEGPVAVLACFVRGVPPSALADALRTGLENLHRGHAAAQQANVDFDWNDEASRELEIAALSTLGQVSARERSARWPVVLLGVLVLLLMLWVGVRQWQLGGQEQRLRDAVATTPGWQLLSLERGRRWALRLLRDPDAAASDDLAARAGIAADQLVVEEIPYLALDDAALARRLARVLAPPPEVQMVVVDGIAKVSGSAPAPWVAQLRERAPLVAGIRALAVDGLVATPDPALEREWQALRDEVEGMRVLFVRGGTRVQLDTTLQLAAAMRRALDLGRMLQRPLSFQVQGWSDEGGSERRNQELRARRAEALRRSLLAAGVAAEHIALAPDNPGPNAPSAGVRWIEGERQ